MCTLALVMLHLHMVLEVIRVLEHLLALGALLFALRSTALSIHLHLISDLSEALMAEWTSLLIYC